ncbi:MAG: hypothetical protein ACLFV7_11940 [Phycisphaerae bacterium]
MARSGDLVERSEYTSYGRRAIVSRGWLKCDLNGDGAVDSADWDLYVYYRSHPQEGASIADYDGDGHVDMDGDGDRIDNQQGRSVAADPLVMNAALESFRTDSQCDSAGGYGSLCDIGLQGLLHDSEFGPSAGGLVHNRARTLGPAERTKGRFPSAGVAVVDGPAETAVAAAGRRHHGPRRSTVFRPLRRTAAGDVGQSGDVS